MIDLVALAGAIVLVVLVQMLRALLAMPLPRHRFTRLLSAPPEDMDGLFAELEQQAVALGFSVPVWLEAERADGEPETMALRALYRSADGTGLLWAAAPVSAQQPHRLPMYFSDLLADGRTAISQPFDCYFEKLQGGDLVARTSSEPDLARQWQAHRAWVQSLGSASVVIDDADLLDYTHGFFEGLRRRLLASGAVRAITPDLAVPGLPLALRLLRAFYSQPKPPPDTRPVPPARLARLVQVQELVSHRAPPRDVQWALFGFSVALFMALGALFWNVQLALSILVVVLLHELGHFLAMRAFGYRNVHILALPLVGGVAIGDDVDPSASKRAWMSLMGPLPGIVIGWALLAVFAFGGMEARWLLQLASVFLFINYLNVLPVPPLDGAHVVEALLPARWARVQTLFIGAAAVCGAGLAWMFDFHILAVLALLQLPALRGSWQLHGVERALMTAPQTLGASRPARLHRILLALETAFGPTPLATHRIKQALQVLHRIDAKPMGIAARLGTSLVYALLLAAPVVGLIGYVAF